jgi:2-polyprenyl-3-methyl-5-hydroxy-6-metoxy-1,4-benzoquinol methylase
MPHSWHYTSTLLQEKVDKLSPTSVLDVGVGIGKIGFLLREQLDWVAGRLTKDQWTARIDGVEVFDYQSPLHDWVYDNILRADILDMFEDVRGYDLVVLSDVLEHIPKVQADEMLRRLAATNRNLIIATPLHFFEQEVGGNPFERHLSHWTLRDFSAFIFDYETVADVAIVVTIAGQGASWPGKRETAVSRLTYRVPVVKHHSSLARVIKHGILAAAIRR